MGLLALQSMMTKTPKEPILAVLAHLLAQGIPTLQHAWQRHGNHETVKP